jgi:hypothetical protein
MSKKYKGKTCVYCTEEKFSETGDHIFAREFFVKSMRNDLPKVPACLSCNNEKSALEHYLTSIFPFGGKHVHAKETLQMVPPRLKKNKKLHAEILANQTNVLSQDGRLIHVLTEVPLDPEKMYALLRFIIRGLSAHYFETILPKEQTIGLLTPDIRVAEAMSGIVNMAEAKHVRKRLGNGTIDLEGSQSNLEPYTTVWRICIYGGLTLIDSMTQQQADFWIYGLTGPSRLDGFAY